MQSRRAQRYGEPVVPLIRAGLVLVALAGTLAAQSWLFWVMWERRDLLVDIRDGVPITEDIALAADDRVLRAALVVLILLLVTAPALMAWMHRAYKNVGAWRPIEYGVGWSIFGWLVPFMNLLRPGKIMVEIVEGSPIEGRHGGLVWWWWLAWLVPGIGSRALDLTGDSVDSLLLAETARLGLVAVFTVAAVLLMVIVARATNDQRRRIARSAELDLDVRPH